jgi:hypothetical protein
VSLLSREAADELGLEPGMLAVAVKTTNVSVEIPKSGWIQPGHSHPDGIADGGTLSEVAFRLAPEARFVEIRTNRHPALAVYSSDDPGRL